MSLIKFIVSLGIDATDYASGLKKAESALNNFGKQSLSNLRSRLSNAFSLGSLEAFTKGVISAAGEIADLADNLQITTEEVQKLQRAARQSGNPFESYVSALTRIKKMQADALSGDTNKQGVFGMLGLSGRESPLAILEAAGKAKGPSQLAAAYDLIGTKVGKIQQSLAAINDMGPVQLMREEDVRMLDQAGDDLDDIQNTIKALAAGPLANFVGGVSHLLGFLSFNKQQMVNRREELGMGEGAPAWKRAIGFVGGSVGAGVNAVRPSTWEAYDQATGQGSFATTHYPAASLPGRGATVTDAPGQITQAQMLEVQKQIARDMAQMNGKIQTIPIGAAE